MEEIAPQLVFVECNLRILREREMGKERMSSAALLIPLIPHSGSVSLASCLLREASCPAALHNMHYTCVCVRMCVCTSSWKEQESDEDRERSCHAEYDYLSSVSSVLFPTPVNASHLSASLLLSECCVFIHSAYCST